MHCHRTFGWHQPRRKASRQFSWFRRWIVEGYSIRQLSTQSHLSHSTLVRIITYWLARPPAFTDDFSHVRHIICDGTFLRRNKGIYAIMDAQTREIIYAAFNVSEGAKDLMPLYTHLATMGLSPRSATVDGNPQQFRYLQNVWPHLAIQRCIIHVHRQGLSWCRRHPVRTDAKHLRKIFLELPNVKTSYDRTRFLKRVGQWEARFGQNFKSPCPQGWVYNDLKAARGMLLRSLPSLFWYLDDPHIPRSTNVIESYFGRMKHIYRNHRGLSRANRDAYFRWYFFLKPR